MFHTISNTVTDYRLAIRWQPAGPPLKPEDVFNEDVNSQPMDSLDWLYGYAEAQDIEAMEFCEFEWEAPDTRGRLVWAREYDEDDPSREEWTLWEAQRLPKRHRRRAGHDCGWFGILTVGLDPWEDQ